MSSVYDPLPSNVENNLSRLGMKGLTQPANKYVETFVKNCLQKHENKNQGYNTVRLKGLMLDPFSVVKKKKKQKRKKTMNARERREKGIFRISKENQRYSSYLPLHELWKQYIKAAVFGNNQNPSKPVNVKMILHKLVKADYHGAIITVIKSKCPGYVGLAGILLQETKNVFRIITKEDTLKMIPKANSVFGVEIEGYRCTLFGNQLRVRSAERSSKKFKSKSTTDL